jgi:3',5'-cyclic AMP phosphodiesterase CpdA
MQQPPAPRTPTMRLVLGVAIAGLGVMLVLAGMLGAFAGAAPQSAAGPTTPPGSAIATLPVPSAAPSSPVPASATPGVPSVEPPPSIPDASGDPVLVGAGDIARCDGTDDEATAALLEELPGMVFTLGDNAYDSGTTSQFAKCYAPSWGRVLDRTAFAVAGNHDYRTPSAAPFKAYFGSAGARDGETWFSQDVGAWHVIVLDANCDKVGGCGTDSPQGRWLAADLAASQARCTLAMWHQPRFSSGEHGNDADVAPFWRLLYAAGADLVLNGHDHDYERFGPQDPRGRADPARGIVEMVVGTGGAVLREFATDEPNAIVRSSLAHGVLVLTLHPAGWDFRFVSTDGSFSDQGSGTCH